ncbi:hypothetical protein [Laspinema palackyanum]|nr:hypothetical protein [Laspinema sp. D2c]
MLGFGATAAAEVPKWQRKIGQLDEQLEWRSQFPEQGLSAIASVED